MWTNTVCSTCFPIVSIYPDIIVSVLRKNELTVIENEEHLDNF